MTTAASDHNHKFSRRMRQMDKRLEHLFAQVEKSPLPDEQRALLHLSVTELSTAMEELHVAQEELRVQNDALVEARVDLKRERLRYKELFDFAPDAYLVTTPDSVIEEANLTALAHLNWSATALRGRPLATLSVREDRSRFLLELAKLKTSTAVRHFSWRIRPRNKPPFDAELTVAPVRDHSGKVTSLRWLIRDVSPAKAAERELAEYRAKLQSLAAELSATAERERRQIAVEIHDRISQNLAMTKLKLSALQPRLSAESQARMLRELQEALALLDQTLEDTRTLTFELSPPILYELGLVPALQWLADETKARHGLNVAASGSCPTDALADDVRALLFQAVRELIVNVVKHARATAVRITCRWTEGGLRLVVADDGRGFDLAQLGQRSASQPEGFGLFSIRTRLEQIGGKMEISSVPGEGTRVTLLAPGNSARHI